MPVVAQYIYFFTPELGPKPSMQTVTATRGFGFGKLGLCQTPIDPAHVSPLDRPEPTQTFVSLTAVQVQCNTSI